jgi:hypothetical protein
MMRAKSISHFSVYAAHAGLLTGVIGGGVPFSLADLNAAEAIDGNATPVAWRTDRVESATARAAVLVEERLLPTVLGPNSVRTHIAPVPFVLRDDVLFILNSALDVVVLAHGEHVGTGEKTK